MSPYATMARGWKIKSLVIGLIAKKLFNERMIARKNEEFQAVKESMHYFTEEKKKKSTTKEETSAKDEKLSKLLEDLGISGEIVLRDGKKIIIVYSQGDAFKLYKRGIFNVEIDESRSLVKRK